MTLVNDDNVRVFLCWPHRGYFVLGRRFDYLVVGRSDADTKQTGIVNKQTLTSASAAAPRYDMLNRERGL